VYQEILKAYQLSVDKPFSFLIDLRAV